MTEQGMSLIQFEADFDDFVRNHFYPPNYRKEPAMNKMTLDHAGAISHAIHSMYPHILPNMVPRARKELEDDILRLKEVRFYLLRQLYEPGLPLSPSPEKETKPHGNSDS